MAENDDQDELYKDIVKYGTGILIVEKDGKATRVRPEDFFNLGEYKEEKKHIDKD